jgi:Tannase and feruloyl esterase
MNIYRRPGGLTGLGVLLLSALPADLAAATCDSLVKLVLPTTTLTMAQTVAEGSFSPPTGQPITNLPSFCRVAGIIHPAEDSEISFEVWIPSAGWNGRFYGIGNGGYAGTIGYGGLANAVRHGYAAASTDTGHKASTGEPNASWALGHPQKVIDFGYRAIHETALKGKAIVAAFYGSAVQHAYFNSCSNGGRQALMEAQRYPEDYDGIVAGAPANYWTHLMTEALWDVQALLIGSGTYIPAAKLPAIDNAVLAACDTLDGVKDGVVDDPAQCHFDPSTLLCKGAESDGCLTAPQVEALRKLYAGPGARIFPGHATGGESGAGGWAAWVTGPAPEKSLLFGFGTQFFKNMVYQDAAWDYHTFNLERDVKKADEKIAHDLNAADADLKLFAHRGGKLILYHGWSDAAISPYNTIDYYDRVAEKLKAKETASFVRLYMAPGMQHCGGGPGPSNFDMNKPMETWVEQGVPPGPIIATMPGRSRPLCPYPEVARWKGSGSTDDAANFSCLLPESAGRKRSRMPSK